MQQQDDSHMNQPLAHAASPVAGVDGCPAGWIVATEQDLRVLPELHRGMACVVGVDMPIGLPAMSSRACDLEARAFLGPRRSSVFPTPARACLGTRDYAAALVASRHAVGVGLSKQSYFLLPKIRQLDQLVGPGDDGFIEVHPECAFLVMNELEPLAPKKSPAGSSRRAELLRAVFGALPATPRGARLDDVLDAYAVLWSTRRFVDGEHRTFGDGSTDERGLPMRIIC
jgi:predicted RNase H-like nuclease